MSKVKQSVGILATGSYLPKDEIDSEGIVKLTDATVEWIERKTQIKSRRYAASDEATSDLAAQAAMQALEGGGFNVNQIAYVIVSTSTGDFPMPPTSYLVQEMIGAHEAACMDINVVCSGFVYGLALAQGLLALHPDRYALVVGAEIYSRIIDFTDRRTAVLLGDGAGAVIVGSTPEPYGIIDFDLSSRGEAHHLIRIEAGGSRQPTSHKTVDNGGHYFRMDGRGVRDFVMKNVPPFLDSVTSRAGFRLDQIDHFVPHQANGVLLSELVQRAGLTGARTHRVLEKYGNVGSASVPITLDEANRSGCFNEGDLVLLAGFGGGMSIGACLLRWLPGASKGAR